MKEAGARVVDVGGESTRPGAAPVEDDEQIRRTQPVIKAIRRRFDRESLLISIDTTRTRVAEAALETGADIINDVSAGRDDDRMFALAAAGRCGLILMHRLRSPERDSYSHQYETSPPEYGGDVFGDVRQFLLDRCEAASRFGVRRDAMVIDPGLGFGKTVQQNFELIGRTDELIALGFPVLSAASRKSFIGAVSGVSQPTARVAGSVAVSEEHRQALAVAAACGSTRRTA
jgi:dihydropteroate synthase